LAIRAADVCSRAARQLICIQPTGLSLRHIDKTDPQCGTVQFCFHHAPGSSHVTIYNAKLTTLTATAQ